MRIDRKKMAADLADLAGISTEAPSTEAVSWCVQTSPQESNRDKMDPLSPLGGDEEFFMFLLAGSVFRSLDGEEWLVTDYEWNGRVEIENRWNPVLHANLPVKDIRRSIDAWIDPCYLKVPPAPEGVVYE